MSNAVPSRALGCLAGTVAMMGVAGSALAAPAAPVPQAALDTAASQAAAQTSDDALLSIAPVQGTFSFDQTTLTPTSRIASMFRIASAALCSSLPDYELPQQAWPIAVGGDASDQGFSATVDEMAIQEEARSYIMGCSCASNLPGGDAIVNAEVQGVSLESIARLTGALK